MRLSIAALALCALIWTSTAEGQQQHPAAVMARVAELDAQCRAAGGRPGNATYVHVYDYTGDAILDYLFSEGQYLCQGRPNVFREGGQSYTEIYVVDRAGVVTSVYRERLIASRILDQRPRVVQIARQGEACGAGAGATMQCGATLRWNQGAGRFDVEPAGGRAAANAPAQSPSAASNHNDPAIAAALPLADIALNATATPAPNGLTPARAYARLAPARMEEHNFYGSWNTFNVLVGEHTNGEVTPSQSVSAVRFELAEMRLQRSPYDVIGALRARGAEATPVACAGEWTNYRITPQGRAPFTAQVRVAPANQNNPMFFYVFTFWFDGRVVTQANAAQLTGQRDWRAC